MTGDRHRTEPLAKAINDGPARGAAPTTQGAAHGRGHRPARRRLPRDRGPAGRVRRRSACSTPRSPSPASSAPRSVSRCAATARSARSSSTASSSPASTRSPRSWRSSPTGTRATQAFPVVIRVPYGGHIGAVEHHQESPEAYFAHTPGLRVVSPATPHDAYWMIQEAIASERPGDVLRAEEPLLAEGRRRLPSERPRRCTPAASCAPAPMSRCVGHGAMVACCCRPPRSPPRRARASRSSTCARSPRSTTADPRLGAEDRPAGRRAGGARQRERRLRDRRDRRRARVLLARGARAARHRLRHPVPARQARDASTCPTPTACSKRSTARWPTEESLTMSTTSEFPLPDVGEGLTEAEIVSWKVKPGDTVTINQVLVEIETAKSLVELPVAVRRRRHASCSSQRATPSRSARRSSASLAERRRSGSRRPRHRSMRPSATRSPTPPRQRRRPRADARRIRRRRRARAAHGRQTAGGSRDVPGRAPSGATGAARTAVPAASATSRHRQAADPQARQGPRCRPGRR